MNSLDKEILNFINKASKRIKINFLINKGIVSLKLLLCLCFTVLMVSLYITIPYVEEVCILILIIGLILSLIYWSTKFPSKRAITLLVDSKGLNERLTTSLELIGEEDSISIAQKNDTLKYIKDYNLEEFFKITLDRKSILIIVGLIVMCILTFFVPSIARNEANKIREFDEYKYEVVEKIEEAIEEIEKLEALTEEEKEEIKKILEDTEKEILEQEKKNEIEKSLERAEKKLEQQKLDEKSKKDLEELNKNLFDDFNERKEQEAKEDINKLVNELAKEEKTEELSKAILSEDEEAIEEALAGLESLLDNMSNSELQELSEGLSGIASSMNSDQLSESLEKASQAVLNKELNLEQLAEALQTAKSNSEASNDNEDSDGEESDSNSSGDGEQTAGDGSASNGSGSGESGNGSGASSNGSGNGAGWNEGSTEGTETDTENQSGEEIFIPGRDVGNDSNLSGNKNESGNSQQIETESGLNLDGEKVDYDKVIGDYTNDALDGINNSTLPDSMKEIIKEYFEGLN